MTNVLPDEQTCVRAIASRDPRFDGRFFVAIRSTGIYCRPSCPSRPALRSNMVFYPSAAAAQRDHFRACKRCRPDATPGSPEWDVRGDLVARAMRLIRDGVIDREGVSGLATRLGYTERHIHRALTAELGAGPLALARAQRAQTARILLEKSALPTSEVAFAAGFASVRQFNDTIREVFVSTPTDLRKAAAPRRNPSGTRHLRDTSAASPTSAISVSPTVTLPSLQLRLAHREPMDVLAVLAFLGARAINGVERFADGVYSRTMRLPHGYGLVSLAATDPAPWRYRNDRERVSGGAGDSNSTAAAVHRIVRSGRHLSGSTGYVHATLSLQDQRDVITAVARLRRLLDLDSDPIAVDQHLSRDPQLRPLVQRRPGLRSPGSVDAMEMVVRAIVGQQISVVGARTVLGRIAASAGTAVDFDGASWQLFPSAAQLAALDPTTLPMPRRRGEAIVRIAQAIEEGSLVLDAGSDRDATRSALLALPGIGTWTADYLLMRALGAPDILLSTDLGLHKSAQHLGINLPTGESKSTWSPWNSYVTHHLWAASPQSSSRRTTGPGLHSTTDFTSKE